MDLNNRFIQNFIANGIAYQNIRFLLAVSAGVDSMVMLHLFQKTGLSFSVAHCNFGLRNIDSDEDNKLVKDYCNLHKIEFFEHTFNTLSSAKQYKLGIQETARKLRYDWFKQLLSEHHFQLIATAHHSDDNAETILFNLIRNTGLKGISGIPFVTDSIIRPLLFASKSELIDHASFYKIPFRNDVSNASNKYARNQIRNQIFPALTEINAQSIKHINEFGNYSKFLLQVLNLHITNLKKEVFTVYQNGNIHLSYNPIFTGTLGPYYLFELCKEYGINFSQCKLIHGSFTNKQSGQKFITHSHILSHNRNQIIIEPIKNKTGYTSASVDEHINELTLDETYFTFDSINILPPHQFVPTNLFLDKELLSFPILLRRWKNGDFFIPFGMSGSKKISDFLIDKKIPITQKKNIWVVESNGTIAAVVGLRIDNRFKLTPTSKTAFLISIL